MPNVKLINTGRMRRENIKFPKEKALKRIRNPKYLHPYKQKNGTDPKYYNLQERYKGEKWLNQGNYIYDEAMDLEEKRLFGQESHDPEIILRLIAKEIKARIKITQFEIFRIGELLIEAKQFLRETGGKFKDYIKDNFDFSSETAVNFMRVFKYCMGYQDVAMNVPISILYKLVAPNFPAELREYLFENQGSMLTTTTNKEITQLAKKFKEGGYVAIQPFVEKVSKFQRTKNKASTILDLHVSLLRYMYNHREQLERLKSSGIESESDGQAELTDDIRKANDTLDYVLEVYEEVYVDFELAVRTYNSDTAEQIGKEYSIKIPDKVKRYVNS